MEGPKGGREGGEGSTHPGGWGRLPDGVLRLPRLLHGVVARHQAAGLGQVRNALELVVRQIAQVHLRHRLLAVVVRALQRALSQHLLESQMVQHLSE
jgi:hypothetical protein